MSITVSRRLRLCVSDLCVSICVPMTRSVSVYDNDSAHVFITASFSVSTSSYHHSATPLRPLWFWSLWFHRVHVIGVQVDECGCGEVVRRPCRLSGRADRRIYIWMSSSSFPHPPLIVCITCISRPPHPYVFHSRGQCLSWRMAE